MKVSVVVLSCYDSTASVTTMLKYGGRFIFTLPFSLSKYLWWCGSCRCTLLCL